MFATIPPHAFKQLHTVQPHEIDEMQHVNNVVYLQWIQEISKAHWVHNTTQAQRQKYLWVVRRHEIDYLRPCFLGDSLAIYTWPLPAVGHTVDRLVVVMHSRTQKIMMQSKTTWHLLNGVNYKTMDYPKELEALF